jgi:lon-related putative ATP-dependent protease
MAIKELLPDETTKIIDLAQLSFKTTNDLKPLDGIIGQDRAIRAINLAMEMDFPGYNVFVTGRAGTGRTTIVKGMLQKYAGSNSTPDDCCYVYNFKEPDSPAAISLPAKMACQFQDDMQRLINTLKNEIKLAFRSEKYEDQKMFITNQFNDKKRVVFEQLNSTAKKLGLQIQNTPTGFQTVVIKDNKPMTPEEFENISEDEKENIKKRIQEMENKIADAVREIAKLDMEAHRSLSKLDEQVAGFVVEQYMHDIKEKYKDQQEVEEYLEEVRVDIIISIEDFLGGVEKEEEKVNLRQEKTSHFRKYEVNVVVDNSRLKGKPVIYESNPTYNNLFGRIEKYAEFGTYTTDFTMIKAGSLLKANGGYLITNAYQMFKNPFVYEALKRTIRNQEIRIEDVSEFYGVAPVSSLKPKPIPLNLKIILIGWPNLYHFLQGYDEDFSRIFKVRADFDYETNFDQNTMIQYAQFIKKFVEEEKLLPFDKTAIREIMYYGHRLVEDQEKLSLQFGSLARIIRESNFWASKLNKKIIKGEHVRKAIEEYEYRHSLIEEKIQEMINKDIFKIVVEGESVGQINGLSVYQMGDYSFGRPNRITAKTYIGNENVVHIERKARLSGKIHDKGVYVLSGFFNWKFGEYIPLSFSASLAFEQSYSTIDGDSASSTELYALISSLADVPINQGIAVTGSVNQNGEVQAIGGVNQKIEGYFKVCKAKGFTGKQGVIIPASNEEHLMLREEIQTAIRNGQFHIYSVENIEDGLKILTGMAAGKRNKKGSFQKNTLYQKVEERLRLFSRRNEAFKNSLTAKKISRKKKRVQKEKGKQAT